METFLAIIAWLSLEVVLDSHVSFTVKAVEGMYGYTPTIFLSKNDRVVGQIAYRAENSVEISGRAMARPKCVSDPMIARGWLRDNLGGL